MGKLERNKGIESMKEDISRVVGVGLTGRWEDSSDLEVRS